MPNYANPHLGLNDNLLKMQLKAQAAARDSEQQKGAYTRQGYNEGGMTAANEMIYRQFQKNIGKVQGNKAFMAASIALPMAVDYSKDISKLIGKISGKELSTNIAETMGKMGAMFYLMPSAMSKVLQSKRDSFEKNFSRELGKVGTAYKVLNLLNLMRYPMRTLPAGLAMLAGFSGKGVGIRPEQIMAGLGLATGAYKGAKAAAGYGIGAAGGLVNKVTGGAAGRTVDAVTGTQLGGASAGLIKKVFGGVDSKILSILGSPMGLSLALAGATVGLSIWKSIKLSRLLPSRKSPMNLERQYSDSLAFDSVLNNLTSRLASGTIKTDQGILESNLIIAQASILTERHTSLLRLMAVETEYKSQEREKQGRSYSIDVLGQDPAGMISQGLNAITGRLHHTIAKYDPITQMLNFIFSGGKLRPMGELGRLEKTYGIGMYGKIVKGHASNFGLSMSDARLTTINSDEVLRMGISHEDRMEKLGQWQGDLLKGIYTENITLRTGFGFKKNVFTIPHENLMKFLRGINPLNLPGIHAISSLVQAPFRAVNAVSRGITNTIGLHRGPGGILGAVKNMLRPGGPDQLALGGPGGPALPVRIMGKGGPFKKFSPFIAGDQGPELIFPKNDGRVAPHREVRNNLAKALFLRNRTLSQELNEVSVGKEKAATTKHQGDVSELVKYMKQERTAGAIKGIIGGAGGLVYRGADKAFSAGKGFLSSGLGFIGDIFKGLLNFVVHNPLLTIAGGLITYIVPTLIKKLTDKFSINWDAIQGKIGDMMKGALDLSNTPIGKYASIGFAMGIPYGVTPGIMGAMVGGGLGGFITLMAKIKEKDPDNIWKKLLEGGMLEKVEQGGFALGGALLGLKLGTMVGGPIGGIAGSLLGGGLAWYLSLLKQDKVKPGWEGFKEVATAIWETAKINLEANPIIGRLAGIGFLAGVPFGLPGMIAGSLLGGGLGVYLSFFRTPEEKEKDDIWKKLSNPNSELVKEIGGIAGGVAGFSIGASFGPIGAILGTTIGYYIGSMGLIGQMFDKEKGGVSGVLGRVIIQLGKDAFKLSGEHPVYSAMGGALAGLTVTLPLLTVNPMIPIYGALTGMLIGVLFSSISEMVSLFDKDKDWKDVIWTVTKSMARGVFGLPATIATSGLERYFKNPPNTSTTSETPKRTGTSGEFNTDPIKELSGRTPNIVGPGSGGNLTKEEQDAVIKDASLKTGVPIPILQGLITTESGGLNKQNIAGSRAYGPMQIMPGTFAALRGPAASYGIDLTADGLKDPVQNIYAGAVFAARNIERFKKMGITDPTATDMYISHWLGPGDTPKFYNAYKENPNQLTSKILPNIIDKNEPYFYFDEKNKTGSKYDDRNKKYPMSLQQTMNKISSLKGIKTATLNTNSGIGTSDVTPVTGGSVGGSLMSQNSPNNLVAKDDIDLERKLAVLGALYETDYAKAKDEIDKVKLKEEYFTNVQKLVNSVPKQTTKSLPEKLGGALSAFGKLFSGEMSLDQVKESLSKAFALTAEVAKETKEAVASTASNVTNNSSSSSNVSPTTQLGDTSFESMCKELFSTVIKEFKNSSILYAGL